MASKRRPPKSNEGQSSGRKPVRTFTDWTYSRIRAAEMMADSGRLSEAVKVCDWLLGDPAVAGALETRRDAILGLTPTFEPSGDKRRSARAVKALEAGSDYWAAYPESELGQLIIWNLLLGVAPGRQPWTEPLADHGGRILPALEFWHPAGLRYDFTLAAWFGKDSRESEFEIVPGDGTHILHTLAKHHPWMLGAWRRVSRFVLLKYLATQDWSKHSEKAAMLVATSVADSTHEQRKALAADIAKAGDDAIAVLQSGFDIKLLELSANTRQIYEAQIEMADKVIATLILGGNLSTNVDKNGSKAAAETQVRAGQLPKLRSDAERLTTTLHDQSLVWWAEFNFGDPALAPWPVYPTEPEEDKKAKADTINVLAEGLTKLDKMGFEFDVEMVKEDYGIDWITGRTKPEPPPPPATAVAPADPAAVPSKAVPGRKNQDQQPGAFAVALASGASPRANSGFVEGQLYVDALVDSATESAVKGALAEMNEEIVRVLDESTSYDDLRVRLRALYSNATPDVFSGIVSRVLSLASLAGANAVNQDL